MNVIKISRYLMQGKENAITANELALMLGLTRRQVVRLVELERNEGIPILASKDGTRGGYYLPKNVAEIDEYIYKCKAKSMQTRGLYELMILNREIYLENLPQGVLI